MHIWERLINFFGRKNRRDITRAGTTNGKACTASAKKLTNLMHIPMGRFSDHQIRNSGRQPAIFR
jgi:hypothetical protein